MSTLLQSLFQYKIWANEELFAEVAKLDATSHGALLHDAIRILNHVYVVDRIFAAHLTGQSHPYTATNTPETPSLAQLRGAVIESDTWYAQYAATVSPALLAEDLSFEFTDGTPARMSREEILLHVSIHGAYHRGAVGRVLLQASLTPPRDILTAYLHKAEPVRRERA